MSADDRKLLESILGEFHVAAFQPPAIESLSAYSPRSARRVGELVELAAARGELVRVADGIWLHGQRWRELVRDVTAAIRQRGELSVADVRELTNSSRKFIVPLLEKLDAAGVTRRVGDKRGLGPKAEPAEARDNVKR